ncbi:MAG: hypothetical protein WB791_09925 [Waddliaceae bacterium]
MNGTKLLYSFFNILIAIFFILLGIIGMLIPRFSSIRTLLIVFIQENPIILSLVGFLLTVIGSAIVLNILLSTRHRHYRIRSGKHTITINESLIQQYLDSYWKELFPEHEIPNTLVMKHNGVHITADFPYLPPSQQQPFLEKIEKDLSRIFTTMMGYDKEIFLDASFPEKGK